jgi:leucyl aminopeptidase
MTWMRFALCAAAFALTAKAGAVETIDFSHPAQPTGGAVAFAVTGATLPEPAAQADAATGGAIVRAMAAARFAGEPGRTLTLFGVAPFERVVLIGLDPASPPQTRLEDFGGRLAEAVRAGAPTALKAYAPDLPEIADDAALTAFGAALGSYAYGKVGARAKPDPARTLTILSPDAARQSSVFARDWARVAAGVTLARDLVSEPSNLKDPQGFVDQVRAAFRGVANVSVDVLDETDMARLGMGAILGVGQGSTRPPRLLAVRYQGGMRGAAPVAFVGKGITFDSGGISLKPGDGMWRMRYDMAGAAASVGAVLALAGRGAKVNAVAVAALAENMPDGGAIRPGDVLTSMSGKTVEVLNTDAEGRLVLADAVWWVQARDAPATVVTVATLTGAVRTALGDDYAGLFANDDALAHSLIEAGLSANEPVWRLPIHESVREDLRADVADMRNSLEGSGNPGASIGAAFIEAWILPQTRWAHLDIAGMAWKDRPSATTPKGAAGFGVRLMDRWVRENAETQ